MTTTSTTTTPPPNALGGTFGQESVDAVFIIVCTFIIFTMQSGFALLESGSVSRKSEANVMVKNMIDLVVGGFSYWILGYAFSFGANDNSAKNFAGSSHFFMHRDAFDTDDDGFRYAQFFFQLSFAATSTTIVSGAVAERVKLSSYMIFAFINTGLVYVFPAHWMWDENGWLYKEGALDFAGTSVVHMAGGISALVAAIILGPRRNRFGANKEKYYMASPTNFVLGGMLLWWGWIGFNCGSTFAVTGHGTWKTATRVAVVTMNGAIGGGLSTLLLNVGLSLKREYLLNIPEFVGGVLGGLVSITAPANVIRPWEAVVIGMIGGLCTVGAMNLINKLKIDDPVGSFAVHYAAGIWGMIATGFFAEGDEEKNSGVFRHGDGNVLAYNIVAMIVISLWNGGWTAIIFLALKFTLGIRLEDHEEAEGCDKVDHNIEDMLIYRTGKNDSYGKPRTGDREDKNYHMGQINSGAA